MRWLRRLVILGLLGGAGAAGYRSWQARQRKPLVGPPEWPPLTGAGAQPATTFQPVADVTAGPMPTAVPPDDHEAGEVAERATWLSPIDGECPVGYPIKANDSSHIFHVPGGRFYARTIPERCYADPAEAERDGYRRAKA
jgi:hypothetical protein